MSGIEEVFVRLFSTLRDELTGRAGVGLALKAEGPDITLRVRSQAGAGEGKRPFFAIVLGERNGAYRISYKPSGVPHAECQVTIVSAGSADGLLPLIRGYLDVEQARLVDYQAD